MRALKLGGLGCAAFVMLMLGLAALGAMLPKPPPKPVPIAKWIPAETDSEPKSRPVAPLAAPPIPAATAPAAAPVASAAAVPASPPTPALPIKLSAMQAWFEKIEIPFRPAPLADGSPRMMGQATDNLTVIELYGANDRLEEMTLSFAMDKNAPEALARNAGSIMLIMRETGWPGGEKWAIGAMNHGTVAKTHGAVAYEMRTIPELGMYMLWVKPVAGKK